MKKKKWLAAAALALVFLVSAGMLLVQVLQYRKGAQAYSQAEDLVQLPDLSALPTPAAPSTSPTQDAPDPETPDPEASDPDADQDVEAQPTPQQVDPYAQALRDMDFAALRQVNPDVVGWIVIPNTAISYPLLQGADDQYYLNHLWNRRYGTVGSIFLESQNSRDLSDFNTIIYGHRMRDRSMFGPLRSYQSQDYWQAHPWVYLTDDNGVHTYAIFAAYEVDAAGDAYRLGIASDAGKQAFLDYCLEQSVIQTGVVPTTQDRVLTLSTCTGSGHETRWVVQAVSR
jgi:sortase B